jgi:hypothetical protein
MEATCPSETSVDFHRTTGLYIPGDRILLNHRCVNLKTYILTKVSKLVSSLEILQLSFVFLVSLMRATYATQLILFDLFI